MMMNWERVDEGWGRSAVDFATLSEPSNCREYVCVHQRLGVSEGGRLLDVATSFRGIWGTTPAAVDEIHRVLVPGGRVGLTVWGHIKASPGDQGLAWGMGPGAVQDG